jgi:hypothetical protein
LIRGGYVPESFTVTVSGQTVWVIVFCFGLVIVGTWLWLHGRDRRRRLQEDRTDGKIREIVFRKQALYNMWSLAGLLKPDIWLALPQRAIAMRVTHVTVNGQPELVLEVLEEPDAFPLLPDATVRLMTIWLGPKRDSTPFFRWWVSHPEVGADGTLPCQYNPDTGRVEGEGGSGYASDLALSDLETYVTCLEVLTRRS